MPNGRQPSFEHEATLEELAGVGKNRRFDEVIDDEANEDLQVICKRGDEVIPLAKPSRAFYFGDYALYDQEAKRFDQEEKGRILNTDQFPRNLARFEELKRSCERGFVIPFLGCSLSADRTILTFMRVAQLEGQDSLPNHYALLACPVDPEKKRNMEQRLAGAHITSLWYPEGEHEHVEEILQLLLD